MNYPKCEYEKTTPETGVQVNSPEPEIPHDDPFANDLMLTHVRADALANLIERARTPYVISIDAEWGDGKTTFLNMLTQHLKNEKFGVISFNAWEDDFTNNPITTLAGQIVKQTKSFGQESLSKKATKLAKEAATIAFEVGAAAIPAAITGNVPGVIGKTVTFILRTARLLGKNDPIAKYDATTQGIGKFKKALAETAAEVALKHEGKPMVVAIDELDRCRPDFAISFLETVKHFFDTPNTVFVITTNLEQMAETVKAVYGQHFAAEEYLDRFFDLPCKLAHANKDRFISDRIKDIKSHWIGLEVIRPSELNFGSRPRSQKSIPEDMQAATELLKEYCERSRISLRRIDKIANRIRLILDLLEYQHSEAVVAITIVSIIRDGDPATYKRILDGSATEDDITSAMHATSGQLAEPPWAEIAEGTALALAHVLPANDGKTISPSTASPTRHVRSDTLRENIRSKGLKQEDKERASRIIKRFDRILELESQSQLPISDAIRTAELIIPTQTVNHAETQSGR